LAGGPRPRFTAKLTGPARNACVLRWQAGN